MAAASNPLTARRRRSGSYVLSDDFPPFFIFSMNLKNEPPQTPGPATQRWLQEKGRFKIQQDRTRHGPPDR